MNTEREQSGQIVNRCWDAAKEYGGTGDYCPGRVGAFKADIKIELAKALREISRLRRIAECNDPGAVGLKPGESLASDVEACNG